MLPHHALGLDPPGSGQVEIAAVAGHEAAAGEAARGVRELGGAAAALAHQDRHRHEGAGLALALGFEPEVLQQVLGADAAAQGALPPEGAQQAALRREEQRDEQQGARSEDDRRAGGQRIDAGAGERTGRAGERADAGREHHHRPEAIGPLPRGGGRRHERRDHQHHADGLEADDHRQRP